MAASHSEEFSQANSLFVDEDFPGALTHYNLAIELAGKAAGAEYYVKRSFCHYKLQQYTDAVSDANYALSLDSSNAIAFQRKGMACFSLEEYEAAKEAFVAADQLSPSPSLKTWIRKCDAEIQSEENDFASSSPAPSQGPPSASVPLPSSSSVTIDPSPLPSPTPTLSLSPSSAPPSSSVKKFRYDWYQNGKSVIIDVFVKKVSQSQFHLDATENSLSVCIKLSDYEEFQVDLGLFESIVPENIKTEFLSTKVVLTIPKAKANTHWNSLERSEGEVILAPEVDAQPIEKPPSFHNKNWDAILKDEPEEKLEGDAALQKVFQDIFKNGSDEQKKAMVKSFTESGGTVLSTNWEDVGKREVKGTPPTGLEMKSWKDAELGQ